jgi:hypothetical protein
MVVGEERHGEVRKEERGGERGERENAKWGSATGWEMQNGKKDIEIHIGLESFIDGPSLWTPLLSKKTHFVNSRCFEVDFVAKTNVLCQKSTIASCFTMFVRDQIRSHLP